MTDDLRKQIRVREKEEERMQERRRRILRTTEDWHLIGALSHSEFYRNRIKYPKGGLKGIDIYRISAY